MRRSAPTDDDTLREFRLAARVMTGIAAAFFMIGGVAVAVAMPDRDVAVVAAAAVRPAVASPTTTTTAPEPAIEDANAPLVVEVTMGEFFFAPQDISVAAGRRVRFEVSNPGVAPHEFLIGDRHAQDDAEKQMAKGGSSAARSHSHDDVVSIYLDPGESGVVEAVFDTPGDLLVGCHVPGHYAAGMKGSLTVTAG